MPVCESNPSGHRLCKPGPTLASCLLFCTGPERQAAVPSKCLHLLAFMIYLIHFLIWKPYLAGEDAEQFHHDALCALSSHPAPDERQCDLAQQHGVAVISLPCPHLLLLSCYAFLGKGCLSLSCFTAKRDPKLVKVPKPHYNTRNSAAIKFMNEGASPAMSCSPYLLWSYNQYGAKLAAAVTQSLVKEHRQEWVPGTCSSLSLLSQALAAASSSHLSCCPEPVQEPLQLCAPHHTGALFRERSVLIKGKVTDAF